MADKPSLQGIALQPQASTSPRPMVRTEQVQTRSAVGDFLSGLGQLQPSLQQFGSALMDRKNDPKVQQDEQARAMLEAMGKDSNALAEQLKGNTYNPKTVQALGARQGFLAATEAQDAIVKAYGESGDPASFDQQAAIAKARDTFKGRFGDNATAMQYFEQGLAELPAKLQAQKTQDATKAFEANRDMTLSGVFDKAMDSASTPKAMGAIMRQLVKENTDFIHAPPEQQGKLLQGLIIKAADAGQIDKVAALGDMDLGNGPLKNVMGMVFQNATQKAQLVTDQATKDDLQPRLMGAMEFASRGKLTGEQLADLKAISEKNPKILPISTVRSIETTQQTALLQQKNALAKQERDNKVDIFSTNHAVQLHDAVRKGTIDQLITEDPEIELSNGDREKIPHKELIETSIKGVAEVEANAAASDLLSKGPVDPAHLEDVKQNSRLNTYANTGRVPEQMKQSAFGVLKRSHEGVEPTQADMTGAQDLLRIKRKAPGLINTIVTDPKDRAFVDSLDVSTSYGMPMLEAVKRATTDRDNFDGTVAIDRRTLSDASDRIINAIANDGSNDSLLGWFKTIGTAGIYGKNVLSTNDAQMQFIVQKHLKQLYARGVKGDALIEQATKAIKANTLNYNGMMLDLTGLPIHDPQTFGPMLETATEALKQTPAYKDIDSSTISWQRVGAKDAFIAVNSKGQPMATPTVSYSQLQQLYIQSLKRRRDIDRANAELNKFNQRDAQDVLNMSNQMQ